MTKRGSGKRREIERFGRKDRRVRVVLETLTNGTRYHRVLWFDGGGASRKRRAESFPPTKEGKAEAIAFAEGLHTERTSTAAALPRLSVRTIWERYVVAEDHVRDKTRTNYLYRWMKFEVFVGRDTIADDVVPDTLDAYRRALKELGTAPNQIRELVSMVKMVFRWALGRKLMTNADVTLYRQKTAKDETTIEMKEFSREESLKVLAELDPRGIHGWRPYVAVVVASQQARRANAILHLAWSDIDFAAGTVTWLARWDKLGKKRVQPMTEATREALWIAYGWRIASGYAGPWVLFRPGARLLNAEGHATARVARSAAAKPDVPWTYQACVAQLDRACKRAGVRRAKYQGMHAFRRGVTGDIVARTGNVKMAGDWIGDSDLRVVNRHYLLERDEGLRETAALLDGKGEEA